VPAMRATCSIESAELSDVLPMPVHDSSAVFEGACFDPVTVL